MQDGEIPCAKPLHHTGGSQCLCASVMPHEVEPTLCCKEGPDSPKELPCALQHHFAEPATFPSPWSCPAPKSTSYSCQSPNDTGKKTHLSTSARTKNKIHRSPSGMLLPNPQEPKQGCILLLSLCPPQHPTYPQPQPHPTARGTLCGRTGTARPCNSIPVSPWAAAPRFPAAARLPAPPSHGWDEENALHRL